MPDPQTSHDVNTHNDSSREKETRRNRKLASSVDETRVILFRIYFLGLIGLSSILLVYYWPQLTFEERVASSNLTITNDTMKLQGIQKALNMTSVSSTDHQMLLDKKAHLEKEILQYQNITDTYRMKLDGKIPLENNDWFFVGTVKIFVIVILSGTLGGSVAAFRSFNYFLGNRILKMSWNSWYIFRPSQGALIGLITYILVRSGIYAGIPNVSLENANLFVVAAGAIVAGLYSDELYSKFHEVFEILFKTNKTQGDGRETPPKYPAVIAEIIDNSLVPQNEIVIVLTKDTSLADQKYRSAFESGKSYWMIQLRKGKEGVYWISDDDKKIICQYHTE